MVASRQRREQTPFNQQHPKRISDGPSLRARPVTFPCTRLFLSVCSKQVCSSAQRGFCWQKCLDQELKRASSLWKQQQGETQRWREMCVVCRDGQIFLLENIRSGQGLLARLFLDTTCFHERKEFLENNPHHELAAPHTASAPFRCPDLGRTCRQVNCHSEDFWTSFQIQNLCQHSHPSQFSGSSVWGLKWSSLGRRGEQQQMGRESPVP